MQCIVPRKKKGDRFMDLQTYVFTVQYKYLGFHFFKFWTN